MTSKASSTMALIFSSGVTDEEGAQLEVSCSDASTTDTAVFIGNLEICTVECRGFLPSVFLKSTV